MKTTKDLGLHNQIKRLKEISGFIITSKWNYDNDKATNKRIEFSHLTTNT